MAGTKGGTGDQEVVTELIDYCSAGFEFITRQNAMNTLKRLNILTPIAIQNMLDAAINPNYKLAGTASQILKDFMIQTRWKMMIQAQVKSFQENNPGAKEYLNKQGLL